jgi:hypothetical protein
VAVPGLVGWPKVKEDVDVDVDVDVDAAPSARAGS